MIERSDEVIFGELVPGDMIVTARVGRLVLSVIRNDNDTIRLTMMCFGSMKKIPPWMSHGRIYYGTYQVSTSVKAMFIGHTTVLRATSLQR